jgi:nucleoside-diphosphate-sugar epimerase
VRPIYASRALLYGLAVALECLGRALHRSVPLTRYKVRSITSPASYDCSAAKRVLGWSPRVGTEAGLKATFTKCENTAVTAAV